MNQNSRTLIAGGFTLLALMATVAVFCLRLHVTNTRAPFDMRLLRSPGESLRKRLEQLNEKLMYCIPLFVVGPIRFAWATLGFLPHGHLLLSRQRPRSRVAEHRVPKV